MKEFGRHRQLCLLIILFLILKVGGPQNTVEAGEGPDPGEPERFP